MSDRVIPLLDTRSLQRLPMPSAGHAARPPLDRLRRPLRDLRISVTDHCNFRCVYCMPKERFDHEYRYLRHDEVLRFEEIERVARILVAGGVRKIRLTGGEPLLRREIETLVRMLAQLRLPDGGAPDLAMTTNGSLLARKAQALAQAGLRRVTVSLDALDDAVFRRMNDVDFPVQGVLEGIEAAARAGFAPVKVNMVVRRGYNEDQILPMARYFRARGHVLRFIEFMDVGNANAWRADEVFDSERALALVDAHMPLERVPAADAAGEGVGEAAVAQRWRYRDGSGEIGTISSVTRAFCGSCTRLRLSTEGSLFLCLFGQQGYDLRALLRGGASDARIGDAVAALWAGRTDRYSELRAQLRAAPGSDRPRIEMSYIGG